MKTRKPTGIDQLTDHERAVLAGFEPVRVRLLARGHDAVAKVRGTSRNRHLVVTVWIGTRKTRTATGKCWADEACTWRVAEGRVYFRTGGHRDCTTLEAFEPLALEAAAAELTRHKPVKTKQDGTRRCMIRSPRRHERGRHVETPWRVSEAVGFITTGGDI